MIAQHAVAKHGATVALPLALLPFDPWWLVFVPLGLVLGWMARAGRMVGESRSWRDIGRDLSVSVLIGGANGLLAALVIWKFGLTYLPGLAVAFACAFGGVQSLETAVRWLRRHIVSDAETEGRKRQNAQIMAAENKVSDLARIAQRLDADNERDGLKP